VPEELAHQVPAAYNLVRPRETGLEGGRACREPLLPLVVGNDILRAVSVLKLRLRIIFLCAGKPRRLLIISIPFVPLETLGYVVKVMITQGPDGVQGVHV